jgi:uncharacterized ferritin-like protein (DUF455 family)
VGYHSISLVAYTNSFFYSQCIRNRWDIIARFGSKHAHLPTAFFSDFAKMALDESKHFSLLVSRLEEVSPATPYGSLPVHAALWESATETRDSLLARLAIVHLVHEARGLDVNPGTIARFKRAGDEETVKVMEVIHADEVTHGELINLFFHITHLGPVFVNLIFFVALM